MANIPSAEKLEATMWGDATLGSRLEVGAQAMADELESITSSPDLELAFRLQEIGIAGRGIHLVTPQVDKGAHPMLLAQSFKSSHFAEDVDLRRVIITHKSGPRLVARNWLLRVDTGAGIVIESHAALYGAKRTADSGPLIRNMINRAGTDRASGSLILLEGAVHSELVKSIYPEQLEADNEIDDFFLDTRPFIGGTHTELSLFGNLTLRHSIDP
jgi:hypothetical protein